MKQELSPKMQNKIAFYRSMRRKEAKPFFEFPTLSPSLRLRYVPLDYSNYHVLHELFGEDDNRFVNVEFKEKERIGIYVVDLREFAKYSPKRGAFDWLIYLGDQAIGVIHLYDMTREKRDDKYKRCTIGFSIAKAYRRNGFASEAIHRLISYVFDHFSDIDKVVAYTFPDNTASIGVLQKLGFVPNSSDYLFSERYSFFEKKRSG